MRPEEPSSWQDFKKVWIGIGKQFADRAADLSIHPGRESFFLRQLYVFIFGGKDIEVKGVLKESLDDVEGPCVAIEITDQSTGKRKLQYIEIKTEEDENQEFTRVVKHQKNILARFKDFMVFTFTPNENMRSAPWYQLLGWGLLKTLSVLFALSCAIVTGGLIFTLLGPLSIPLALAAGVWVGKSTLISNTRFAWDDVPESFMDVLSRKSFRITEKDLAAQINRLNRSLNNFKKPSSSPGDNRYEQLLHACSSLNNEQPYCVDEGQILQQLKSSDNKIEESFGTDAHFRMEVEEVASIIARVILFQQKIDHHRLKKENEYYKRTLLTEEIGILEEEYEKDKSNPKSHELKLKIVAKKQLMEFYSRHNNEKLTALEEMLSPAKKAMMFISFFSAIAAGVLYAAIVFCLIALKTGVLAGLAATKVFFFLGAIASAFTPIGWVLFGVTTIVLTFMLFKNFSDRLKLYNWLDVKLFFKRHVFNFSWKKVLKFVLYAVALYGLVTTFMSASLSFQDFLLGHSNLSIRTAGLIALAVTWALAMIVEVFFVLRTTFDTLGRIFGVDQGIIVDDNYIIELVFSKETARRFGNMPWQKKVGFFVVASPYIVISLVGQFLWALPKALFVTAPSNIIKGITFLWGKVANWWGDLSGGARAAYASAILTGVLPLLMVISFIVGLFKGFNDNYLVNAAGNGILSLEGVLQSNAGRINPGVMLLAGFAFAAATFNSIAAMIDPRKASQVEGGYEKKDTSQSLNEGHENLSGGDSHGHFRGNNTYSSKLFPPSPSRSDSPDGDDGPDSPNGIKGMDGGTTTRTSSSTLST